MTNPGLKGQWQKTLWNNLSPRAQQVAYLSGLGWKIEDISRELFTPTVSISRIREIIRCHSTEIPCDYEPFTAMTSEAVLEITGPYTPGDSTIAALAKLGGHELLMAQKIAEGLSMSEAGLEVYGYQIETGQVESMLTEKLGVKTRAQLQVLMQNVQVVAAPKTTTGPNTPGS